jgi:hypothetical protein
MATKDHKDSMSQPERTFWREVFLLTPPHHPWKVEEQIKARADFADAAVIEYRRRVMWRQRND